MKMCMKIMSFMLLVSAGISLYGAGIQEINKDALLDEILIDAVTNNVRSTVKLILKKEYGSRELISNGLNIALANYKRDKEKMNDVEFILAESPVILDMFIATSFKKFGKIPENIKREIGNMPKSGSQDKYPERLSALAEQYQKQDAQEAQAPGGPVIKGK